ncbi:MAG: disulfide bond formation protein B [Pseudomonadota bacterium]|nr:disulfide bond formation protein B [Pseudomonadota bacterium]
MKTSTKIALLAFLILLSVHIIEWVGYTPCDLCLKQRWAWYFVLIISAISSGFDDSRTKLVFYVISLVLYANAVFAIWHAGIEWNFWEGTQTCYIQSSSLGDNFLNNLKSNDKFIPCNEASIRVFGLSLAAYNAIASILIASLALLGIKKNNGK